MSPYREVDHTADVAVEAWGEDLAELFAAAAEGMYGVMGCVPESDGPVSEQDVSLEAEDVEALLVEWLSELLYLSETRGECLDRVEVVHVDPTRLKARLWGRPLREQSRHIKAITYSYLKVEQTARGVEATVTFDV